MNEDKIPYDDPSLRSTFRRGWKACLKGEPRPEEQLFRAGRRAEAWVKGYEAAGCS
jgi:hypothetical protein